MEEYLQRLLRPLFKSVHGLKGAEEADKVKDVVEQSDKHSAHSDLGAFLNASMNSCVSQGSQIVEAFALPRGGKYQGRQCNFEKVFAHEIPHSNRQADWL